MPAYAVIEFSKVGRRALAAAVGPQLRAQDVEHGPPAGLGRTRAALCRAVD